METPTFHSLLEAKGSSCVVSYNHSQNQCVSRRINTVPAPPISGNQTRGTVLSMGTEWDTLHGPEQEVLSERRSPTVGISLEQE